MSRAAPPYLWTIQYCGHALTGILGGPARGRLRTRTTHNGDTRPGKRLARDRHGDSLKKHPLE
ncbi:hypothetical protein PA7_34980 [Pseudonocardia asaccharolytica DSM 44247 = NBRC 16224]|uniref:Uncharacterized protein n=1 Tax=Pseudonocardia asaccharolytica DSM 44247 = NBRC 16224 TaxID=1123024 RepID=A0A511D4F9_9PSEU|nr:hypothetical protein PA7_34980 [Pseudonocardia asaccharolytica DSM 44247 = NBRC 16224]